MKTRGIRLWHVVAGTLLFFAAILLAGMGVAATASGSPPTCTNVGPTTTTVCQSPGNAQITTSPGGTIATPNWGGWPFWGGGGLVIGIG